MKDIRLYSKRSTSRLHLVNKITILPKFNRSQGHVEMMISFILFITFIIMIFYFLNPISEKKTDYSAIQKVEKIFLENVSSAVGKLTVYSEKPKFCYTLASEYSGNHVVNIGFISSDEKYKVYYLYYGDFLIPNPNPDANNQPDCNENKYTVSSYSEEKIIVYENLAAFKENYSENYGGLKSSLGISKDFAFEFSDLNGNKISELSVNKESVVGFERVAKQIPVRVINKNGNILEYIMTISVW